MRIILFILFFIHTLPAAVAWAGGNPAVSCIEKFLDTFSEIKSYRAVLDKKEFDEDGDLRNDELLEIEQRQPTYTKITYLNEGSTGIKNNGMTAEYDGTSRLKVQLGHYRGLGFFVHQAAAVIIGHSLSITEANALRGEYFTMNQAGFRPFAKLLRKQLPGIQSAASGG